MLNPTPFTTSFMKIPRGIATPAQLQVPARNASVPRMSMTLEVPDEIQRALRVPEPERQTRLLVELACGSTTGKSSASARRRSFRN
jgi:hypothetical protein